MSSRVSESTPSRFAFASAALNLASASGSTVSEPSREGTEAFVGGCSGFLCGGEGAGSAEVALVGTVPTGLGGFTELALVGWEGLLTGRGGFTELALISFGGLDRDCGFTQLDRRGFAYAAC
jgi:hypothetical protein